jgi:hypothetical protein
MEENIENIDKVEKVEKVDKVNLYMPKMAGLTSTSPNPWANDKVDKLEFNSDDFNKTVEACRFFYKKDPIASSTINKLVEVGINDLLFSKNKLSDNEFRIFDAIKDQLIEFCEAMAMEYLISGLVVPEIAYSRVPKNKIEEMGIKKYDGLILPTSMWLRDPKTIEIKPTIMSSEPSYLYKVPDEIIYFIQNKGEYSDGTKDPILWAELKMHYGDFVTRVQKNETKFILEDHQIFRRKSLSNDSYPTPYLHAALENLKHKRNLRRMDYSIAARVISAIQLFKLGNDEFPVTEDNAEDQFDAIRNQIYYRDSNNLDVERVFQLFANHTLEVEWIYPDTVALLNEKKYDSINQDIIYALGFPRILITGESEKTGTSDPQYAMMSPSRTMEHFRRKIIKVVKNIVYQICKQNNFKSQPVVKFKPLTLFDHETLLKSLADLYAGGNLSRTTYAEVLGHNWDDETEKREYEQGVLKEKGLPETSAQPFSNNENPNSSGDKKPTSNPATNKSKPSDVKKTSNNSNGEN